MKKQEKVFFTENLTEELKSAKSVILVNYAGLTVKAQQELKKRLSEVGSKMLVVKNTLLKRAAEGAKINAGVFADTILTGQTALVISEADPLAPIQVLGKFAAEFEVPKFKIGLVEGSLQDEAALTKISALPSKDILLSQVLGTLISPQYGLVGTLNANMQKLVYVLDQKSKS